MTVTTVLFDLDGTLWDSLPGITGSLAHALACLDMEVPDDETLASNVGPPLRDMLRHFGVAENRLDDGVSCYRDRYRTHGVFEAAPYPGAHELLEGLRTAGFRLATATSKGEDPTRRMLDHFGFVGYFDVIAAASMDGRAVHKAQVIAMALDGLGESGGSHVAMVGDRRFDIEGGKQFDLRTVGASWGYGPDGELAASKPDVIVATFDQLASVFANWGAPTSDQ